MHKFRLYILGQTYRSLQAVANTRRCCQQYFPERSRLEIIDIAENPHLAEAANIIVIPTLLIEHPSGKRRRVIGAIQEDALIELIDKE